MAQPYGLLLHHIQKLSTMKTYLPAFAFLLVFLSACNNNDVVKPMDPDNLIIGFWADRQTSADNQMTLTRVNELPEKNYAIQFDYADKFVERKSPALRCSLPDALENFDGTWTKDGARIRISVGEWMGGTSHYVWRLIDVDEKYLTVELLWDEYTFEE